MRTCPLLPNTRHRAMITPVRPLRTRLILARVSGQFFVRLKFLSKGNYPLDWNSNSLFYANQFLQKTVNLV